MAKMIGTVNDQFIEDLIALMDKHWRCKPEDAPGGPVVQRNQLDIVASLAAPLEVVVGGLYGTRGQHLVTELFSDLDELDVVPGAQFGMVTD
jgi:hypothetical protein